MLMEEVREMDEDECTEWLKEVVKDKPEGVYEQADLMEKGKIGISM